VEIACRGIGAVNYGALILDDHRVSTTTTPKVGHCEYHGFATEPERTTATGLIKPPFYGQNQNGIRPGKLVLDVHVRNGAAYTAASEGK
jgi:hypothetical protein